MNKYMEKIAEMEEDLPEPNKRKAALKGAAGGAVGAVGGGAVGFLAGAAAAGKNLKRVNKFAAGGAAIGATLGAIAKAKKHYSKSIKDQNLRAYVLRHDNDS